MDDLRVMPMPLTCRDGTVNFTLQQACLTNITTLLNVSPILLPQHINYLHGVTNVMGLLIAEHHHTAAEDWPKNELTEPLRILDPDMVQLLWWVCDVMIDRIDHLAGHDKEEMRRRTTIIVGGVSDSDKPRTDDIEEMLRVGAESRKVMEECKTYLESIGATHDN